MSYIEILDFCHIAQSNFFSQYPEFVIIGEGIDLSSLFTTTHQHSIYITADTTPDAADPKPIDLTFHHSTSLTLEKDPQIFHLG